MKYVIKVSALVMLLVGVLGLIGYMGASFYADYKKTEKPTIIEKDGVKYYYSHAVLFERYEFIKAVKTVTPRDGYNNLVNNQAELTVKKDLGDWIVDVSYERWSEYDNTYSNHWSFRSGIAFTEESLYDDLLFGKDYTDYHIITEYFATEEELRELVLNGIRLSVELNIEKKESEIPGDS